MGSWSVLLWLRLKVGYFSVRLKNLFHQHQNGILLRIPCQVVIHSNLLPVAAVYIASVIAPPPRSLHLNK